MVHVTLMFLSEWCEFRSVPCLAEKKKNLMTAHVSMLKLLTSPGMLPLASVTRKDLQFDT